MRYTYFMLDVFTRTRLTGNPLAVILGADRLTDDQMQRVAREFNLSETVFLRAPMNERHLTSLRIFSPRSEVAFAGHPTIGCAVLLGLRHRTSAVRIEEKIGVITALTERINSRTGHAAFGLPQLPFRVDRKVPPERAIADTLGIFEDELGFENARPGYYSAGLPCLIVPVKNPRVLARVKIERRGWSEVFGETESSVYVVAPGNKKDGFDFVARMFDPMEGIDEDPATGSAAGALAGLLAEAGEFSDGPHDLSIQQGTAIGRPSTIGLQMRFEGGKLCHAGIGGDAVIVAEGLLDLPD
ncbi:MAG: PhzF family phenazine biosynthesis protein [Alphaproteobacteria bacterium]|nr:PhzF family phenazine biosynthesis protein [Alphaproteobacteria bacterium]